MSSLLIRTPGAWWRRGGIVIGGMEGEERGGEINIDMVSSIHDNFLKKYFTSKIFFTKRGGGERGADEY